MACVKNHEDSSMCMTMYVLIFDEACCRTVSVTKCISFHPGNLSDQYPLVIFGPSPISTTAQVSIPQLLDLTLLQHLRFPIWDAGVASPVAEGSRSDSVRRFWMNHDLIHGRREKWKDEMFILSTHIGLHCQSLYTVFFFGFCVLEAVDRRWNAVQCEIVAIIHLLICLDISWPFSVFVSWVEVPTEMPTSPIMSDLEVPDDTARDT